MIRVQVHHLFNIQGCSCRCLHEYKPILLCKLFPFLFAHSPPMGKITLVTNEHDCHVSVCMLLGILKPACQMIKRLSPGQQGFKAYWFQKNPPTQSTQQIHPPRQHNKSTHPPTTWLCHKLKAPQLLLCSKIQ